ncbi:MAG TPA: hypothetical protein VNK24_02965 [Elusimicrobiota bacterium]|nr:hypothetical protein [Elusimicrobiota bacterium]
MAKEEDHGVRGIFHAFVKAPLDKVEIGAADGAVENLVIARRGTDFYFLPERIAQIVRAGFPGDKDAPYVRGLVKRHYLAFFQLPDSVVLNEGGASADGFNFKKRFGAFPEICQVVRRKRLTLSAGSVTARDPLGLAQQAYGQCGGDERKGYLKGVALESARHER